MSCEVKKIASFIDIEKCKSLLVKEKDGSVGTHPLLLFFKLFLRRFKMLMSCRFFFSYSTIVINFPVEMKRRKKMRGCRN